MIEPANKLAENHPLIDLVLSRSITGLRTSSLTFRVLEFLIENPQGLNHRELMSLLGDVNRQVLRDALNQLGTYAAEELASFGYYLHINKSVPNRWVYSIGECPSAQMHNEDPQQITKAMCMQTQKNLATVLKVDREVKRPVRILHPPPEGAENLLHNSTWAMHVDKGTYAVVKQMVTAARKGSWVTTQALRASATSHLTPDFFHNLERISFQHGVELGFVVRCLTELPERGRFGAFFLNQDDRAQVCGDLYPNDIREGSEITYFDKVRPFEISEFTRRLTRLKRDRTHFDFDPLVEKIMTMTAEDQSKGVYTPGIEFAERVGVSTPIVKRSSDKSVANRADWKVCLRRRVRGGLECVLYEGPQD